MRKLILSILFILCLSFQASAWCPTVTLSGSISAPALCTSVQAPSETDVSTGDHNVGKYNDRTRVASQFVYAGTTGKAICKVRLYVDFTGSSTHNYVVEIMSDNADTPNAVIGTSDAYDLKDLGTSETTFDFEFSTPSSALTNSVKYWVVLKSVADADDVSNFAEWHTETLGTTERIWDYDTTGAGWTEVSVDSTKKYILYSL